MNCSFFLFFIFFQWIIFLCTFKGVLLGRHLGMIHFLHFFTAFVLFFFATDYRTHSSSFFIYIFFFFSRFHVGEFGLAEGNGEGMSDQTLA